ncbi:amidohydrolase 2 [Agrocybe pediades]|nr:amidohydrolase 2 [Agrocybe pediades]
MAFRRIDIHHHYFPPDLAKEKINADVGWITPQENLPWSPRVSLCAMDEMSIDYAVLSFPAISSGSVSDENRAVARARNVFAANVCSSHPHRFGFFATLPFLDDVEGCLQEIAYAFDHLQAQGVSFASSYGEGSAAQYLGDNRYDPIWDELDRRGATAFIHGSQTPSSTPFPHAFLGLPICEVPNETFKAAAHLVVTSKKRKFSNIKFILAHMGGTVPYLAPRVAILSRHMGCPLTPEEIIEDFKTFYYETALSAYESTLAAIDVFVPSDHILFGTDFPAVSKGMAEWFTKNIEKYCEGDKDKLEGVMGNNAWKILNNVSETRTTGMT